MIIIIKGNYRSVAQVYSWLILPWPLVLSYRYNLVWISYDLVSTPKFGSPFCAFLPVRNFRPFDSCPSNGLRRSIERSMKIKRRPTGRQQVNRASIFSSLTCRLNGYIEGGGSPWSHHITFYHAWPITFLRWVRVCWGRGSPWSHWRVQPIVLGLSYVLVLVMSWDPLPPQRETPFHRTFQDRRIWIISPLLGGGVEKSAEGGMYMRGRGHP